MLICDRSQSIVCSSCNEQVNELQCKDIPDKPILEHVYKHGGTGCSWFDVPGSIRSVVNAMPIGTPQKLVLAKMRMMIRKGVISGCPCGCRGEFQITPKGLIEINNEETQ